MRELDPLISEYAHEKQLPREAEALHTIRKIASLVKPIMRARNWRVGTLAEFYPAQPNLLGICFALHYRYKVDLSNNS
jgi:DNA-dependent metalloprotease WSS1